MVSHSKNSAAVAGCGQEWGNVPALALEVRAAERPSLRHALAYDASGDRHWKHKVASTGKTRFPDRFLHEDLAGSSGPPARTTCRGRKHERLSESRMR